MTKKQLANHPYLQRNGILVIAHRGGGGLAPENTMEAFRKGVALGSDILELDIRASEDGVLMVIHDESVERISNGDGNVHQKNLKYLKELDAGYRWTNDGGKTYPFRDRGITIPTLEELFQEFPDMRMNIDIKQKSPSIVEPFGHLIRKYRREDRTLVASFDHDTLEHFRTIFPEVLTAAGEKEARRFIYMHLFGLGWLAPLKCAAFQLPEFNGNMRILTKRFIRAAHRRGMQVHPWTIDSYKDLQRFIDLGVDGIMTNFPDRLQELLNGKKAA